MQRAPTAAAEGGHRSAILIRGRLLAAARRPDVQSLTAGMAMQATLVISGVVVARALGPVDRGYLAFLSLLPVCLWQLGSLGLPVATTYFLARGAGDPGAIVRRVRSPALLQAAALLFVHALLIVGVAWGKPHRVLWAGALMLAMVPACLAQQYGLAVLQGLQRFAPFNVLRVLPLVLYSASAVILVLLRVDSLETVSAAFTVSYGCSGAASLALASRVLAGAGPGGTEEAPTLRSMSRFGARSLLGFASPIETFRLDQALVGLLLPAASLGVYVVALAFTNLPRFIGQSLGMVAYPSIASRESDGDRHRAVWRYVGITMLLAGAVVVVLEFAAHPLVMLLFGPEFEAAVPVVRVLLAGSLFFAGRRVLTDAARGLGLALSGSLAEALSWLAIIPLLAVFVSEGIEGVAVTLTLSSAISFAFLALIVLVVTRRQRLRDVPVETG